MNIHDGGTAYPFALNCPGMSLRDWFAGQALAGLCTKENCLHPEDLKNLSQKSYEIANAMIEKRKLLRESEGHET